MTRILINFRTTSTERERFKRAAAVEGLSLSAWMRRLALLRAAELADRLEREPRDP